MTVLRFGFGNPPASYRNCHRVGTFWWHVKRVRVPPVVTLRLDGRSIARRVK